MPELNSLDIRVPVATDNDFAVRCKGVTKTFGEGPAQVFALRGIDLDVRRGELMMIVGPSGCGKTTLLSIISAILEQDEGCCEVYGNDLSSLNSEQRAHFRSELIGFVFQLFNLLPALTALENVAVPLLVNGMSRKIAMERARMVLDAVDLASRAEALPARLSGGQQQRVAIARALVHEPKLIVCDEPTSSLDHKAGHDMMALLRDVARSPDRSLIVVTHDDRILPFADRVAYMEDGKIVSIENNKVGGA